MGDERTFEERYEQLREEYGDRVLDRIGRIEELAEGLGGEYDEAAFDELYRLVHRLSGSGETMGFPRVSELSIELEERLERARAEDRGEWLEEVGSYCREIRDLF